MRWRLPCSTWLPPCLRHLRIHVARSLFRNGCGASERQRNLAAQSFDLPSITSAIKGPSTGANLKPWPLSPAATVKPIRCGWRSIQKVAVERVAVEAAPRVDDIGIQQRREGVGQHAAQVGIIALSDDSLIVLGVQLHAYTVVGDLHDTLTQQRKPIPAGGGDIGGKGHEMRRGKQLRDQRGLR